MGTLGSSRISLPALIEPAASVPEVTVAAVAARDKSRAGAFALRHGIPAAYESYEELLADPDIDAIYNPLPNSLHGPWTLQAIAAGKHVLCEKPFASNADEAAQVADAAAASGLVVMEAMHYRYHPLTRRLSELVAELGPVQHLQCWTSWRGARWPSGWPSPAGPRAGSTPRSPWTASSRPMCTQSARTGRCGWRTSSSGTRA